jgi:hypothetical protein
VRRGRGHVGKQQWAGLGLQKVKRWVTNKSFKLMSTTESPSTTQDGDQNPLHAESPDQDQPEASTSRSQSSQPPETSPQADQTPPPNNWQAIFSPHHNAYYFYNTVTHETTWENPLQPGASSVSPPAAQNDTDPAADQSQATSLHTSTFTAVQQAALARGIDPSLAYLDPSLLSTVTPTGANTFTAKFNARTGTFTRNDARDPSHLSEYERAKRMSEFYFDVAAWENGRESEAKEEEGKKRKRPTKKDLVSEWLLLMDPRHSSTYATRRIALKSKRDSRKLQRRRGCANESHCYFLPCAYHV